MKNIEISEEFYNYILSKKSNESEDFESILKKIIHFYDFNKSILKKVVFIGEAGVGKSTIRKILFDYTDPDKLIKTSLEPTRGLEFFSYSIFETKCSVIDTSGQEIFSWLDMESEQVFPESDIVVFVVDATYYLNNTHETYDLLKKIIMIARSHSKNATISLFLHKIDLINQNELEKFKEYAFREHKIFEMAEETDVPLFFTSIKEPYVQWLNIAFIKLLRIESLILPNYKKFLDDYKNSK